jgi:hypothetical protein
VLASLAERVGTQVLSSTPEVAKVEPAISSRVISATAQHVGREGGFRKAVIKAATTISSEEMQRLPIAAHLSSRNRWFMLPMPFPTG